VFFSYYAFDRSFKKRICQEKDFLYLFRVSMIKTQKTAELLKAFDASKGRISKLRRSSSNIIMLRFVKGRNSQLRRFSVN